VELQRETGSPAQSTLRSHLAAFQKTGVVVKRRGSTFPSSLEYELAEPGRELRLVTVILESWLAAAPDGPLQLGTSAGKAAVRALADAWSSTMLRALAIRPLTLTALDSIVTNLNYPALERRLTALRLAGLVEPASGNGAGTPYALTRWLRRGVAPLAAASRWERRNARAAGRQDRRRDGVDARHTATQAGERRLRGVPARRRTARRRG
jgi:DNA-binding HxlR family transcriptional regulator